VLDTLRTALANVEADLAVLLARHLDRPREARPDPRLLGMILVGVRERA